MKIGNIILFISLKSFDEIIIRRNVIIDSIIKIMERLSNIKV